MIGRVLVVSQDTKLREFLDDNLPDNGYEIFNTGAEEALVPLMDELCPHLVIMDVMMPLLDGIELCLSLRQQYEVPVLLLSTWEAGEDEVRGFDVHCFGFLTRPMSGTELRELAESAIQYNYN